MNEATEASPRRGLYKFTFPTGTLQTDLKKIQSAKSAHMSRKHFDEACFEVETCGLVGGDFPIQREIMICFGATYNNLFWCNLFEVITRDSEAAHLALLTELRYLSALSFTVWCTGIMWLSRGPWLSGKE